MLIWYVYNLIVPTINFFCIINTIIRKISLIAIPEIYPNCLLFIYFNIRVMKKNLHLKGNNIFAFAIGMSLFLTTSNDLIAQNYIHPNQAGVAGGNTSSAGLGSQVVVSTYLGAASSPSNGIQGTIFVSGKNGTNKFAIADFAGFPNDGSYPFYTTPQQMSDGNLYGTSFVGGTSNLGTVYKFNLSSGSGACGKSIVNNNSLGPSGSPSGAGNYANVNELSDGKLYVAYSYGGTNGYGQIIRMNKDGSAVEVLKNFLFTTGTVVYTLPAQLNASNGITPVAAGQRYDGAYPYGFVTEGADGKIYGTCVRGGTFDYGIIWRMDKNGGNFEVIHACDSRFLTTRVNGLNAPITSGSYDMLYPWGNVAQDQLGRIYVNGYNGGEGNFGGLSRMNSDGSNVQILMSGSAANGTFSYRGPLIIDNEVFGTFRTNGGGNSSIGVLWKYDILTNTYTKLKTFEATGGYQDGYDIWAGVAFDGNHLYGTAIAGGGSGNVGTLWKIKRDGTEFQVLHRFSQTAGDSCGAGKASLFSYFPSAERVTFANVSASCSKTCFADGTPLPINLKKFTIERINETTELEWTFSPDQNIRGFEVERSSDGVNWTNLGFVNIDNNKVKSITEEIYKFTDVTPLVGKNYYRLKQLDFDYSTFYSEVLSIYFGAKNKIQIFPNPANGRVQIIGLKNNDKVFFYDVLGNLILQQNSIGSDLNINTNNLPIGNYNIRIIDVNGSSSYHKVLIK